MAYQKENFEDVFSYIADRVAAGDLPSAVFGVTGTDEIIDLRAYGKRPDGGAIREDDMYVIFSVTKPVVGLAVMQLCEQGLLHPWDPVNKYIPGFEANGKERVRIWHLLTHSSGLKQDVLANWWERDPSGAAVRHEALCSYFIGAGLEFEPGTAVKYNNLAFSVLAEIINRVSGTDYADYLQSHIFTPLGMEETGFDVHIQGGNRNIPIYDGDNRVMVMDGYHKLKYPAGGLFSKAPDLLKLGRAMLNEGAIGASRIVSPLTLRQMISPQTLEIASGPDAAVYGLAWRTPVNKRSLLYRNIYGHNGMGGCMLWVYPEQKVAFVLMTNQVGLRFDISHIHNVFSSCL